MRRKSLSLLLALVMLITLLGSQLTAFAADSGVSVQFSNGNTGTSSNTISAKFKVTNNTGSPLNLADLKLRYYYTIDEEKQQSFWCDHSGYLSGNNYIDVTSKVKGSFVKLSQTTATADTCLEISFASDAGNLPAGGSIEIQTRAARNDWSNYNQANDYSYKAAGSYVEWNQITAYKGVTKVFGEEPIPGQNPSISPTDSTFKQGKATDIPVTLTPNGNTFKGILGLTQDTDYTVSGNSLVLKQSYLNTLGVGTKTLVFDFGVTNNPTLVLTIQKGDDNGFTVSVGSGTGSIGQTVTIPVKFSNVAKVNNIGTCNFYLGYDTNFLEAVSVEAGPIVANAGINFSSSINNGTISFLFLDNTIGNEIIKTDGVFANIKFKLKSVTQDVTTPITHKAGGAFGDGTMSKITDVTKTDGSVTIKVAVKPEIKPDTATVIQGLASDLSIGLVPNGYTFSGVQGLVAGTDYVVDGTNVKILKSYLNTLPLGAKELTFDFGADVNPVLTITVKQIDGLAVTVGTAAGAIGDTVNVPVSFSNVSKVNNIGTCNFYLGYDTNLLEAVSVEAGPIVANAGINFSSSINNGTISFLFLDNTIGNEIIKTDGVFANIKFKLKSVTQDVTTPITHKAGGAFGDGTMSKITDVTKTDGSVTIKVAVKPEIKPDTATVIQGLASDLSIGLVPNGYTFSGVQGLVAGTDYVVDGTNVKILKSYLNTLSLGTKELTFDFGADVNPVLTITVKQIDGLAVTVGTAAGAIGDTVKVPVSFSNVSKVNNVGTCNFYLGYDTNLLEAVSVEAGPIVANAGINFSSSINNGTISFLFLDNSIGNELIKTDGVFANITFKLKTVEQDVTTPITHKAGGAFGDGAMSKITNVTKIDGSVTINIKNNNPSITPVTSSFKQGNASDISVTLIPNGNTFVGIDGLAKGTDYVVTDTALVISKAYLNTLTEGTKVLSFDFGVATKPTLTINVTSQFDPPAITPVTSSFEQGKSSNIDVTLIPNGNTFIGIDGLAKDTDYTVSGSALVLLKSYLDTLPAGTKALNFNFGTATKPTLTITVTPTIGTPVINPIAATVQKGSASDVSVALTPNGNTFKGINGLVQGTDYTVSGNTVVLSKSFLNTLPVGTKVLTFDFGAAVNPVLTITVESKELEVAVGTATGKSGDTVTVPVTFANVAKVGNIGTCNFYLNYDASLLNPVSIEAGPIITNAGVNFSSSINNGTISFLFLDNSIGNELIKTDGVFANIKFALKATSKEVTTPITHKAGGAFGDGNMKKITTVNKTNGSVTVQPGDIKEPSISPETSTFEKGAASDLAVTLTLNGNTFNGITGLTAGTDYKVSDNTVVISKSYLNALAVGTKVLSFDFGTTTKNLTIIVKDGPQQFTGLGVVIDKVNGVSGGTVTVPVKLVNVAKMGNVGTCNFYINYDANALEATSVAAGSIIKNAGVNFSSAINSSKGTISILFLDNTIGSELITGDGAMLTITFKIKGTSGTSPVTFKAGGAFGNGNMSKITDVTYVDGSVQF